MSSGLENGGYLNILGFDGANWINHRIACETSFSQKIGVSLFFQNRAPPACANLQYFAIIFLKLSRKTIIYLLHVCWPMPICRKGKRKREKKQNKKTKSKKKHTHESNKDWVPWG
jgi:hypothetical protein